MLRQALPGRIAVVVLLAVLSGPARAEPRIGSVSPRGLQLGGTTTIVVDGDDLLPDCKLLLPIPGVTQTVKPGGTAKRVEIEVSLAESAGPGIVPLRVASGKGVSNPVAVGIDALPQLPFAPEIDGAAALSGNLGGQILRTSFQGTKGETWLFEVEAQRLGSGVRPVLRLYDERGTQVAFSQPQRRIDGDARLLHTFAADGRYTVELHEPLYRGANPPFFRLKIGPLKYADLALPLAIPAGTKTQVQLRGGNLTATVEQDASGIPAPGYRPADLPADSQPTAGPGPTLLVSDHPELVEAAAAEGQVQSLPSAPIGISGTLAAAGEEDKYMLAVKPGQKLRFEVFAQQLGSPLDGVLSIRNAQGNQLATNDDRPGTSDPAVDVAVPAGVEQLQVVLKDLKGAGGEDFVYRIAVKDLSRPDFAISLGVDHLSIPAGGTAVLPVTVNRLGYTGGIDLAMEGLPEDVQLSGQHIPAGATMGLLTLTATGSVQHSGLVRVLGRASDLDQPLVRLATVGDVPGGRAQPYLKQWFAYGVAEAAPISIAWNASTDKLLPTTTAPIVVTVNRKEGASGNIRLRLLTTQSTPQRTVKENNRDKKVDDVARTIRLDGESVLSAEKSEAKLNVLVPSNLAPRKWDLTVVAELLAADNKTVLTSVAAPSQSFTSQIPFSLELTTPATAEGRAGAGEAGKFAGKISRVSGFDRPVVITLSGLPKGILAPSVLVPGDQTEFELPLVFPHGSPAGELKNLKLLAFSTPVGVSSARSKELPVTVNLLAGEKPAVDSPHEVFEENEAFAMSLTQGGGKAAVVGGQKFSGEKSLRISPDQKFNPKLPNLGVAIREKPGPGEYRYLQYAWRKQGGAAICLQLSHDEAFGPTPGGHPEASFRYHAGPAPESYGAAVRVSDQLPNDFVLVTRDLYADFGEFTLTGLAFSAIDGQQAFFDHIYLARSPQEFDLAPPKNP